MNLIWVFKFVLVLLLGTLCRQCYIPDLLFDIFFWTGYFNSCLNPIIYACSSRDFKRAFRSVLYCAGLGSDRDIQSFRARTINFTLRSTRRSPAEKKESGSPGIDPTKMTFDVTKIPPLIQPQYSLDSESPGSINENNCEDELPPSYQSIAAPTIAEAIKRVNSVIRAGSGTDTDCTVIGTSEWRFGLAPTGYGKFNYQLLLIIRWWYLFCGEPFFVSPYGDDAVVVNHSLVKSGFLAYQYLGLDQELRHQLRHAGHYWLEQCFSNVSPNVAVDLNDLFLKLLTVFSIITCFQISVCLYFGFYDSLKSTRFDLFYMFFVR